METQDLLMLVNNNKYILFIYKSLVMKIKIMKIQKNIKKIKKKQKKNGRPLKKNGKIFSGHCGKNFGS